MAGKSAINTISTIGVPNLFCNYKLTDGSPVNVKILDTAGQERFRSINTIYCRSANCCLLVYDITNRQTFLDCKTYFNEIIKQKCPKNIQVILLGNKTDLEEKRQVSPEEAAAFSLENNYIFMETSCLKNENVADAFETLIELTHRELIKMESEKKDEENNKNIKVTKTNNKDKKHKKKSCC